MDVDTEEALFWLLGRGGSLSMPRRSDDETVLIYRLDATAIFQGRGGTFEVALATLHQLIRDDDRFDL